MKNKNDSVLADMGINFSQWYLDIVYNGGLAENSSIKGCMIILPYGYSLWENIQFILNKEIKSKGAMNMAFPLLIPYSYFEKEIDHIEGFAPEVALVTSAGGKKLEEPLVVRPTSEVIIHEYFKNKIKSWRDLPLKVNQWCSVVRWEKRPRPFIRTTEFWWQEGHTAHETTFEAKEMAFHMIQVYADFCENYLAIPVVIGKKPQAERFAGADCTWTIEAMMQDGKALQMGTSHLLGSGFVDAINIAFQDRNQKISKPTLTSWGVTTRLIGAIAMVHGDNRGIVMPPKIAPVLLIIIPIYKNDAEKERVYLFVDQIISNFKNINSIQFSYEVDDRKDITPGVKFSQADLKGIPFRIDLGIRDLEEGKFTFYTRFSSKKDLFSIDLLSDSILFQDFLSSQIDFIHKEMYSRAVSFRGKRIKFINHIDDNILINNDDIDKEGAENENNFYVSFWCGEDYQLIKEKCLTVRCLLSHNMQSDFFNNFDFDSIPYRTCCVHKKECPNLKKCIIAKSY